MIHPNLKRAWIEWEDGANGVAPILVIETDLDLSLRDDGPDSSNLDDMIDAAKRAYSTRNKPIYRSRIVPVGAYRD